MMTTQKQIRAAFWQAHPHYIQIRGFTQNEYNASIRCAFVDYVDFLQKSGEISEALAYRVTL